MRTIRKRVSHPTRRCFFQRERGRIAQILCGRSNDASGRRRCEFDECRVVIVGVLPVRRSLRFNLTIESKGIHIVVGSSHTMSPPPLPPRLLRLPPPVVFRLVYSRLSYVTHGSAVHHQRRPQAIVLFP